MYHRIKNKFRTSSGCPALSVSTVETEYPKVNFLCHLRLTSLIICSDGSGGSRVSRGGGNPKGRYQPIIAENCMKMKKIRPRWWGKGARPKFYFVDPSLDGSMDPGFPRGGEGRFTYSFYPFSRKCMKLEKLGQRTFLWIRQCFEITFVIV